MAILQNVPEDLRNRAFVGTADILAERIQAEILDAGVEGVIVNAPFNGHVPGVVTALGETPSKAIMRSGLPKETRLAAPISWWIVVRSTSASSSTETRKKLSFLSLRNRFLV